MNLKSRVSGKISVNLINPYLLTFSSVLIILVMTVN